MSESAAAGAYTFCSWLAGLQVPLVDISFPYPAPDGVPLEEYQRIFGATVRFDLFGFGEQSTCNHAFRAWFETTPAAWRATQGAPG